MANEDKQTSKSVEAPEKATAQSTAGTQAPQPDPTALSIVRRLGGVKAIADLIEIPKVTPVTVHGWIHNGLPPNYTVREALKRIARKKYKKGEVLTKLLKDIREARTIRTKKGLHT